MSRLDQRSREPAVFRFDPHGGGSGLLGLGFVRTLVVGTIVALGVLSLYEGRLVAAAALLLLGVPFVLASWQGLPLLLWLPLRIAYRLAGPRRWETDPEVVGMTVPLLLTTPRQGEQRC